MMQHQFIMELEQTEGSRIYLDSFEKGEQATATVTVSAGGISSITFAPNDITGIGYTIAPTVTFSSPVNGATATAVAIMTSRTVNNKRGIDRLLITNPGYGYTESPTVKIY